MSTSLCSKYQRLPWQGGAAPLQPPGGPGGFTLHMTGYTPAYTKSVEKGSFLDIRWRRRLLQKGYIFRC